MKEIRAVIRPEMLDQTRAALESIGCYHGIMISDIVGHGVQKGVTQTWRGEKFRMDLIPKVMINMIVKDEDVPSIKKAIMESSRTGDMGDGKIFIYNVEEVIRIRTGEESEDAL